MSMPEHPEHRKVDYLRLAVTDRCNLRCLYCMPPEGVEFKPHDEILSYEDMTFFVRVAMEAGISKVRLTGGEPLVRRDLPTLVSMLREEAGIKDISLTTNGILLADAAPALAAAGLARVNISVDSLDPERYRRLTRGGSLRKVFDGIEAAFEAGLTPVKLNVVLMPETIDELGEFVGLTRDRPIHVRFIEWMPIGSCGPQVVGGAVLKSEVLEALERYGELEPAEPDLVRSWGPARYYQLRSHEGTLGFISSVSDHFCDECNRLRMTADGRLMSCLFSRDEVRVREALRAGDEKAVRAAIEESLGKKVFDREKVSSDNGRGMSQIGG